eukprot:2795426-Rhodomonas_salina.1
MRQRGVQCGRVRSGAVRGEAATTGEGHQEGGGGGRGGGRGRRGRHAQEESRHPPQVSPAPLASSFSSSLPLFLCPLAPSLPLCLPLFFSPYLPSWEQVWARAEGRGCGVAARIGRRPSACSSAISRSLPPPPPPPSFIRALCVVVLLALSAAVQSGNQWLHSSLLAVRKCSQ